MSLKKNEDSNVWQLYQVNHLWRSFLAIYGRVEEQGKHYTTEPYLRVIKQTLNITIIVNLKSLKNTKQKKNWHNMNIQQDLKFV